jgi:hypothetical protein
MANPISFQQALALSKGLNYYFTTDGISTPITFEPIEFNALTSETGIVLAGKAGLQIQLWESAASIGYGKLRYGFGNPVKVGGEYPSIYNIKKCNDSTINNAFKFSYYDYFGDPGFFNRSSVQQGEFFNTEDGEFAPEPWMQVEKNYINNDHIVNIFCFNSVYDLNTGEHLSGDGYNTITILSLGNPDLSTESDGFIAYAFASGDNLLIEKANGAIDILGTRFAECDSFIFDPFNGPVYPSGRLNNIGTDYEDLKPVNYDLRIVDMFPLGLWIDDENVVTSGITTLSDTNYEYTSGPISLPLFRTFDVDIYTNIFLRCSDANSIDNIYPFYPYSKATGSIENKFNDFGGLDGTLTILKNATTQYWEQGLANSVAVSGQAGIFIDGRNDNSTFQSQLSAKNVTVANQYSTIFSNSPGSMYDLVDTQRRSAQSPAGTFGQVKPIETYKCAYFDFIDGVVKGCNKKRIAAGFFTALQVDVSGKIDAPQTVYSNANNPNTMINVTKLVRKQYNNSTILATNPNLIDSVTNSVQMRELFTNDLDDDGVADSVAVDFESVDLSGDVVLATLDSNGSVRILFMNGNVANNSDVGLKKWVYFTKEDLEAGYLTDDEGLPVTIPNENYVDICATGGYGGTPTVVWCLHETGELYGIELVSSVVGDLNPLTINTKAPLDANFGKNASGLAQVYRTHLPNTWQTPTSGGGRNFIKTLLNKIPKSSSGQRFKVISMFGGYQTVGGCVAVNPRYNGETTDLAPYQEVEIVSFADSVLGSNTILENMLKKIQQRSLTGPDPLGTGTYTYGTNSLFNRDLYNNIFAYVNEGKGGGDSTYVYVPPVSVTTCRAMFDSLTAAGFGTNQSLVILGNNGNFTVIGGSKGDFFVNPSFARNTTTITSDQAVLGFVKTNGNLESLTKKSRIFNSVTSNATPLKFYKPGFLPPGADPSEPVFVDLQTGTASGFIVIPGLSFDQTPSGLQQFEINQTSTGISGGDFNLDGELTEVEKQLHYTGMKILKKLK